MENRAWHGTRLSPLGEVPHPHNPKQSITFEIGFHHTRGQYFVNKYVKTPRLVKYRNGKQWVRQDTTGHYTGFSDTINGCIKWVHDTYGITLNLLNDPIRNAYKDKEKVKKRYLEFESWDALME